jgi:nitrogen fixation protein NifU and related proteins
MNDLRELYQEVILDHSRRPRNFGACPNCNRDAKGHNPLCGDRLAVHLDVEGDIIRDAHFEGQGCAISVASASLMTEMVKGKTVAEAKALFEQFHAMVTGEDASGTDLDKLEVLAGVRDYPVRVKCATLAWHTLAAALDNSHMPVVTE